ncbi:hypothetical protein Y1Q_0018090 [Alligator mississippiensis]|uniref:Uncharacterized protein n=1 Tax=Alligator mississippiensis TaxID=8496 RepID=A0A151NNT8_ALLMI|nr:hypothetical protein Y1Q_0018090 [Alligator mississippiensis]
MHSIRHRVQSYPSHAALRSETSATKSSPSFCSFIIFLYFQKSGSQLSLHIAGWDCPLFTYITCNRIMIR